MRLQQWVVSSGAKICLIVEGRDAAGKGGVIRRITERVSEREKTQMCVQRYLPHLPAGGEW